MITHSVCRRCTWTVPLSAGLHVCLHELSLMMSPQGPLISHDDDDVLHLSWVVSPHGMHTSHDTYKLHPGEPGVCLTAPLSRLRARGPELKKDPRGWPWGRARQVLPLPRRRGTACCVPATAMMRPFRPMQPTQTAPTLNALVRSRGWGAPLVPHPRRLVPTGACYEAFPEGAEVDAHHELGVVVPRPARRAIQARREHRMRGGGGGGGGSGNAGENNPRQRKDIPRPPRALHLRS